ncbi:MAG: anaerobic ribonucleoside-triphosphate reductase activating protein [Firmicutes bacterium]|nr:anaerobic ribonucleoside-triphosphate reductase activating protein [Bacillota bacterium]
MKIHGLQKMTLLDFPGHVACTVFTGGCDFRCPFCHNFELVDGSAPPVMEEDELLSFLEKRKGLLDGVAFTGGEPCLQKNLPQLIRKVREMGYSVKLDTNGNHPVMLRALLEEGLVDYVAMDIKNSPEKYALTCGLEKLELSGIYQSVSLLMNGCGGKKTAYEFRTTVVDQLHRADDFEKIGRWLEGADAYFLQAFTDRESVPYEGFSAPKREDLFAYARIAAKYIPNTQVRGID